MWTSLRLKFRSSSVSGRRAAAGKAAGTAKVQTSSAKDLMGGQCTARRVHPATGCGGKRKAPTRGLPPGREAARSDPRRKKEKLARVDARVFRSSLDALSSVRRIWREGQSCGEPF